MRAIRKLYLFSSLVCITAGVGTASVAEAQGSSGTEASTFLLSTLSISDAGRAVLAKSDAQVLAIPGAGVTVINTTASREALAGAFGDTLKPVSRFDVSLFASDPGCDDPSPMPGSAVTPFAVCRAVGPQSAPAMPPSGPTVWIVDSGLDAKVIASNALKVSEYVDCIGGPCSVVSSSKMDDKLGHGTAIAGVVGATAGGTVKLFGVRPGTSLGIVRAFGKNARANLWKEPLAALTWLSTSTDVKSGDIVNISWGSYWGGGQVVDVDGLKTLEGVLQSLADKGVRVVMAAGNAEPNQDPPWVEMVIPANMGGYKSLSSVAAVASTQAGTTWTDDFWQWSAYGKTVYPSDPPQVAEPGVDVLVLWRSVRGQLSVNKCSGTSFAAPIYAGLLALGVTLSTATSGPDKTMQTHPVNFVNGGGVCALDPS